MAQHADNLRGFFDSFFRLPSLMWTVSSIGSYCVPGFIFVFYSFQYLRQQSRESLAFLPVTSCKALLV